jgi:hypothetical protein
MFLYIRGFVLFTTRCAFDFWRCPRPIWGGISWQVKSTAGDSTWNCVFGFINIRESNLFLFFIKIHKHRLPSELCFIIVSYLRCSSSSFFIRSTRKRNSFIESHRRYYY